MIHCCETTIMRQNATFFEIACLCDRTSAYNSQTLVSVIPIKKVLLGAKCGGITNAILKLTLWEVRNEQS